MARPKSHLSHLTLGLITILTSDKKNQTLQIQQSPWLLDKSAQLLKKKSGKFHLSGFENISTYQETHPGTCRKPTLLAIMSFW
jgi:hypothetical protein